MTIFFAFPKIIQDKEERIERLDGIIFLSFLYTIFSGDYKELFPLVIRSKLNIPTYFLLLFSKRNTVRYFIA